MQVKILRPAVFAIAVMLVISGIFVYRKGNNGKVVQTSEVDIQKLAQDYKNGVMEIWSQYQAIEASPKKEGILSLRNKLLELTMPAEFKEAHLDFTIGLSLLEEGLKSGSNPLQEKGRKRIEKFKQDNAWLNSK